MLVGVMGVVCALGCASIPPAQVGQTAGTIAGAAILPGVGAPLGALVGLLAGMLVQGEMDQATEKHERKELNDQLSVNTGKTAEPGTVTQGQPTRVWVDETVTSGRLMAGHFDTRDLQ